MVVEAIDKIILLDLDRSSEEDKNISVQKNQLQ